MTRGRGDDAYRYGKKIKLDFSANVYNHADLTGLQQHLAANMDCIRRYPEPEAYELEWKLSEHLDIPREYAASISTSSAMRIRTACRIWAKTASTGCAIPITRQATCS